jgi:hypothetical protein
LLAYGGLHHRHYCQGNGSGRSRVIGSSPPPASARCRSTAVPAVAARRSQAGQPPVVTRSVPVVQAVCDHQAQQSGVPYAEQV